MLVRRLTVVLAQRSGDCCHLFWKWWLTSRSQTGRQNILKNHDNRGFLLLVMNFQNYLSVTTKRSDRYLFPQKLFMRIPSTYVCRYVLFEANSLLKWKHKGAYIIELNLTYHFENMIDLKIYSTEITIALLSPQTIEKVLPSTCFADIRLLDQIGRQGYCSFIYFRLAP